MGFCFVLFRVEEFEVKNKIDDAVLWEGDISC